MKTIFIIQFAQTCYSIRTILLIFNKKASTERIEINFKTKKYTTVLIKNISNATLNLFVFWFNMCPAVQAQKITAFWCFFVLTCL